MQISFEVVVNIQLLLLVLELELDVLVASLHVVAAPSVDTMTK